MKYKLIFFFLIIICFFSCTKHKSVKTDQLIKAKGKHNIEIKIIDTLKVEDAVLGYNEYLPLATSPSGNKLLIMNSRGGQKIFIINLNNEKFKVFDLKEYEKIGLQKSGINTVGFVSDTIISIFYKNILTLLNTKNKKIVKQKILPKGVYSSYTKKVVTYLTDDDTLYLSQYYSPNKSEYEGGDAFYDLSPLSIYSSKRNDFLCVFLPKSSKFKKKNLGQPIVNFVTKKDTVYYSVSPERKLYSFILDKKNFKINKLKAYSFMYGTEDSVLSIPRSKFRNNISQVAIKNPFQSNIVAFGDFIVLSYAEGISNKQYRSIYSNKFSREERREFVLNIRNSYLEVFNLEEKTIIGNIPFKKNISSLALKIKDSLYVLKPKSIYYYGNTIVPFYIAKLQIK